jgi:hypothetical protein
VGVSGATSVQDHEVAERAAAAADGLLNTREAPRWSRQI